MATSWNKKEREKKKQLDKKNKAEKKLERKENAKKGKSLDEMMAYLDENGNLTSTPPDPSKKIIVNAEDIEIGVPKLKDRDPADSLRKGVVTFFNNEKGYGFIKDKQTMESIFVHVNSAIDEIKENSIVLFEVEKGPRGLQAVNVKLGS
ncbi:cold-shock protein [Terrimonas pollutisoli]|uniref:cold-shock protein n=1 Tax=Terrimonas pollutisoli TaxID=3034147 RepID=UPI0023EB7AE1|nr:cold shock domain-containing protein [Terrimonas sp. H1YJ31]